MSKDDNGRTTVPGAEGLPAGTTRRSFLEGAAALTASSLAGATAVAAAGDPPAQEPPATHFDYPPYKTAEANDAAYARYVSASHVQTLQQLGSLNVHYGQRENARVQDVYTGKWFWDCHRNGSKFNLGHRNPQLLAAMREAMEHLDAGSFATLSGYRARLAEKLVATTGGKLEGVTFGVSGADSIEIAVHAARNHTKRKKLVAISKVSYHGGSDLALSISGHSAEQQARYQVSTADTTFVPYNDLEAMQAAITEETAAVVMETSPAQAGFPRPADGYLPGVKAACERHGAALILDEVQTGLGGCGTVWAYEQFGVEPDIVCTGKALGGGLYPISAAIMSRPIWHSYTDGQFLPLESTYAGAEIGCVVASRVLEITTDPTFLAHVRSLATRFAKGFESLPLEVTQLGLCMGLRTAEPMRMAATLGAAGILAGPSFDDDVVPFRPVLTLENEDADDIIARVQKALS